jgi:hypothetical protein
VHDDNKSNSGHIGQVVVMGGNEKTHDFFLWMYLKNYLTYSQLLQNLVMDYCDFGYITKLTKKLLEDDLFLFQLLKFRSINVKKKLVCSYSWLDLWTKLLKV